MSECMHNWVSSTSKAWFCADTWQPGVNTELLCSCCTPRQKRPCISSCVPLYTRAQNNFRHKRSAYLVLLPRSLVPMCQLSEQVCACVNVIRKGILIFCVEMHSVCVNAALTVLCTKCYIGCSTCTCTSLQILRTDLNLFGSTHWQHPKFCRWESTSSCHTIHPKTTQPDVPGKPLLN